MSQLLGAHTRPNQVGYVNGVNKGERAFVANPECSPDSPTFPRPEARVVQGRSPVEWRMIVKVTDDDGLEISDVWLKNRYMAPRINLPYYRLKTSTLKERRAELKPDGDDAIARSRLVDFQVREDSDPLVVEATYVVDRLGDGSKSYLCVTQRYEFYSAEKTLQTPVVEGRNLGFGVEPTHNPNYARFNPIVKYEFHGADGEELEFFNSAQRLHFRPGLVSQPNGNPGKTVALFKDSVFPFPPFNPVATAIGGNPLSSEALHTALARGREGTVDNIHQTWLDKVFEPSANLISLFPMPGMNPELPHGGAPEGVHIHWRWMEALDILGEWDTNGDPLIPEGSEQSLQVAYVVGHEGVEGEDDPQDFTSLVNGEVTRPGSPDMICWYSATGWTHEDTFFGHGGFFGREVNAKVGDVTADAIVKLSNWRRDRATGRWKAQATIETKSQVYSIFPPREGPGLLLVGPVSLVFDRLRSGVTLYNRVVDAPPSASPYVNVPLGEDGVLSAGEKAVVNLEFENPDNLWFWLTLRLRVLAGPGAR